MKERWEPSSNKICALIWLFWLPIGATAVFSRVGVCLFASPMCRDETEGSVVLSVAGVPVTLFAAADSVSGAVGGASTSWQRLV